MKEVWIKWRTVNRHSNKGGWSFRKLHEDFLKPDSVSDLRDVLERDAYDEANLEWFVIPRPPIWYLRSEIEHEKLEAAACAERAIRLDRMERHVRTNPDTIVLFKTPKIDERFPYLLDLAKTLVSIHRLGKLRPLKIRSEDAFDVDISLDSLTTWDYRSLEIYRASEDAIIKHLFDRVPKGLTGLELADWRKRTVENESKQTKRVLSKHECGELLKRVFDAIIEKKASCLED